MNNRLINLASRSRPAPGIPADGPGLNQPPAAPSPLQMDLPAIRAGLEAQVDDLIATVEAQQARLDDLARQLARRAAN
ncbi:hypothetical protein [Actinoplanes sp. L3-i22]|uniref:hypothetical protein n=1 Tax=Actinoplanes sp. L3-i22 TaxID=2836373 RepID=UPI001C76F5CD|nr:hypothetical protein [Actinoplanes sp. L3-i22]BCY10965.1 hypothetical protein L3i22_060530 [Actinoplanes sp. L3-i22]